jgi:hypothetical protein
MTPTGGGTATASCVEWEKWSLNLLGLRRLVGMMQSQLDEAAGRSRRVESGKSLSVSGGGGFCGNSLWFA